MKVCNKPNTTKKMTLKRIAEVENDNFSSTVTCLWGATFNLNKSR